VKYIKKSILTTKTLFRKTPVNQNKTRWNGQAKVVRRFLKVDPSEVVESKGLLLTRHDKAIMKETVEILELFEEATDIVQGN